MKTQKIGIFLFCAITASSADAVGMPDIKLPFPGGETWEISTGYNGSRTHRGRDYYAIDFNIPGDGDCGKEIPAVADGVVVYVNNDGVGGGYGNYVDIDHSGGYVSRTTHFMETKVSIGDNVVRGQTIGLCGTTGDSTGCHIHFVLYHNGTSVLPEPMSGYTGFIEGQEYTSDNHLAGNTNATFTPSNDNPVTCVNYTHDLAGGPKDCYLNGNRRGYGMVFGSDDDLSYHTMPDYDIFAADSPMTVMNFRVRSTAVRFKVRGYRETDSGGEEPIPESNYETVWRAVYWDPAWPNADEGTPVVYRYVMPNITVHNAVANEVPGQVWTRWRFDVFVQTGGQAWPTQPALTFRYRVQRYPDGGEQAFSPDLSQIYLAGDRCGAGVNGDLDYCHPLCPCVAGEGHCDNDFECEAGLRCVPLSGGSHELAPWINVCETGGTTSSGELSDADFLDQYPDGCADMNISLPAVVSVPLDSSVTVPSWAKFVESGPVTIGAWRQQLSYGEVGADDKEYPHIATLTNSYALGKTEVTEATVLGLWPSWTGATGCSECAAGGLTYYQAIKLANDMSESMGLSVCYDTAGCTGNKQDAASFGCPRNRIFMIDNPYNCAGVRLPTEAEWVKAAKAGSPLATPYGNLTSSNRAAGCDNNPEYQDGTDIVPVSDLVVWCGNANSLQESCTKPMNPLGFCDMYGNGREWVNDPFGHFLPNSVTDPVGCSDVPEQFVLKGGTYASSALQVRVNTRLNVGPNHASPEFTTRFCLGAPGIIAWNLLQANQSQTTTVSVASTAESADAGMSIDSETSLDSGNMDGGISTDTVTTGVVTVPEDMVPVFAGTYIMGPPPGETELDDDESPPHQVTLTRDYWVSEHPVTNAEWQAAYPATSVSGCSECPVVGTGYYGAIAFANWRSREEDLPECYTVQGCTGSPGETGYNCTSVHTVSTPYDCEGYRLLTEAEWEYMARAGTTTTFFAGRLGQPNHSSLTNGTSVSSFVWSNANSGSTKEVCTNSVPLNSWGICDTAGNVWEFVSDGLRTYTSDPQVDPLGPPVTSSALRRGGAWNTSAKNSRHHRRVTAYTDHASYPAAVIGFRLARTAR